MRSNLRTYLLLLIFALIAALVLGQSSAREQNGTRHNVRQILNISGSLKLSNEFATLHLSEHSDYRDEHVNVDLCELKLNPSRYNHKLISINGFISHGFEDFTLLDPQCPAWPDVWLEYGGTTASGTMYCCGVTADRSRAKPLVVEKTVIPLTNDEQFAVFDKLIHRRPDSIVHATIVGRFFAGRQEKSAGGVSWGGYGHMGCCSLLAIQRVLSVDPQNRNDLDYRSAPDQPDTERTGCGFKILTPIEPSSGLIEAQRTADEGELEWVYSDPERVAIQALVQLVHLDEKSIRELRETRRAQGRFVYEWNRKGADTRYMVVVSRPYLLSFYAKDTNRVAWTVIAAYESSCGSNNSVTRLR